MSKSSQQESAKRKQATRRKGAIDMFEGARLSLAKVESAMKKSRELFLSIQYPAGYWAFDLEADVTIPSEYVMLKRFLGHELDKDLAKQLGDYIISKQMPDGGWPLYDMDGQADISASVKAYFALKLLGYDKDHPRLVAARQLILSLGGAERCNVFTRITLALFGQIPWDAPPAMPIELLIVPKWFFIHLSKVSYWSRTVIVPLLILYAKQPVCRLHPREIIAELFVTPPDRLGHLDGFRKGAWIKNGFIVLDRVLKKTIRFIPSSIHEKALARAEEWTRERMQGVGGIGAIFPAMANAVMALKVLGAQEDDPDFQRGLAAVDDLLVDRKGKGGGGPGPVIMGGKDLSAAPELAPVTGSMTAVAGDTSICQPCVSPIWDTCLALSALLESGLPKGHTSIKNCLEWIFANQIHIKGDWADKTQSLDSGGWAFQFENAYYPDVDDTAMVVMSMLRADVLDYPEYRPKVAKAVNWVIGMQSANGGWGAFDIDNNALYLNNIPFADHGALLDPPTSDLTGRCIEMLGMLGYGTDFEPIARGIEFLKNEQEEDGSWFGRWGVNYIYGTWSVLCGLRQVGVDLSEPFVRKAVDWLKSRQNRDGGWGETCYTYDDPSLAGRGDSTPSQTAWALLGLMAAGEVKSHAVSRGIRYLLDGQKDDGSWKERHFTGTGFPRVFYLLYHGYAQYFPLWALGVYGRLTSDGATLEDESRFPAPPELHLPVLASLKS